MSGFASEDYELAQTLSNVTGVRIAPSLAREIAGHWAAAKVRRFLDETRPPVVGSDMVDFAWSLEEGQV